MVLWCGIFAASRNVSYEWCVRGRLVCAIWFASLQVAPDDPLKDGFFDKPFEPRLAGEEGEEGGEGQDDNKDADGGGDLWYAGLEGATDVLSTKEGSTSASEAAAAMAVKNVSPLVSPLKGAGLEGSAAGAALRVGVDVILIGLSDPRFNGRRGTIVTKLTDRGRHGVRLEESGNRISVLAAKVRVGPR